MILLLKQINVNLAFPIEIFLAEYLISNREKRKGAYGIKTAIFLGGYIVVASLFGMRHVIDFPLGSDVGAFTRYILLWGLTVVWLKICFFYKVKHIALILLCGYVVQHSAYSMENILLRSYIKWIPHTLLQQILGKIFIYILVYTALYFFFLKKVKRRNLELKSYTLIMLVIGTLVNVLVLDITIQGFEARQRILFRLLSIFDCVLVLSVVDKVTENYILAKDIEFIEQLSSMKKEYYDSLKESMMLTNMKCHDFKYQIRKIRKEQGETAGVCEELEKSIDTYGAHARTGNENLDVMLTEKNMLCQNKNIQFTYMVDGEKLSFMEPKDIYSLFGNLLDNAIEAVEKILKKEKKIIGLQVWQNGKILNVQMQNYYEGTLRLKNGLPETTKNNQKDHGYGMKSVLHIVQKYNGEMFIKAEDSIFECNIVIPLEKS